MLTKQDCQKGMLISFEHKKEIIDARIVRVNQKTITIEAIKGNLKGRLGYGVFWLTGKKESISHTSKKPESTFTFLRSRIQSQKDLENILEELKVEMALVFNSFTESEQDLLDNVRIRWGNRITFCQLGKYTYSNNSISLGGLKITLPSVANTNDKHNLITISKSLQNTPEYAIKYVVYHEMLHIKHHDHGTQFKGKERMFPMMGEANQFEKKLCREIRVNRMSRIRNFPYEDSKKQAPIRTPTPKPIPKPKKVPEVKPEPKPAPKKPESETEKIIRELKEANQFPESLNGKEELDEWDIRFLKMKHKKL
jgi:metallopeptidase YgjP-like protein